MALILPYSTMSAGFAPTGAATVDQFSSTTVHSDSTHNNPHSKLLANDVAIKAYIDTIDSLFAIFTGQNLLASPGYQKFVGGLIVQWGEGLVQLQNTQQIISFPVAFDNACLVVILGAKGSFAGTTTQSTFYVDYSVPPSTTQFVSNRGMNAAGASSSLYPVYFAIGY